MATTKRASSKTKTKAAKTKTKAAKTTRPTALAKRAAKEIRQAQGEERSRRGRTTTEDERTLATLLERRLHQLGLERAKVEAVATKPGQPADLRISGIPVGRIDELKTAIGR